MPDDPSRPVDDTRTFTRLRPRLQGIAYRMLGTLAEAEEAGRAGGQMTELCDHCLRVPSDSTPRIQEGHITIDRTICYLIEQQLFPKAQ